MATLAGDLRFAVRSLRANPGFTAIAVASLALGIGANTAIFSLVDQLLLWSVPAREPERLVRVDGGRSSTYPFLREYQARNQVFSGLCAASQQALAAGVRPEGAPAVEVGRLTYVSGNFFGTLGVGAAAGRVIADGDDAASAAPVAVLSYDYWERRFAGDPRVIGRKLAVNGFPIEIAGVAERGFGGLTPTARPDAFLPLTAYPLTTPGAAPVWDTPGMYWLAMIGRLKPGISMRQAEAGMRVVFPQAAEGVNAAMAKRGGRPRKYDHEAPITLLPAAHSASFGPEGKMDPLAALLFATGLVLLIACANLANLLLARATGRRREMAVRAAVGATRGRLVRQLLTESLLLAGLGGVCAVAVAYVTVLALAKGNLVDADLRFRPSLLVAAFSAGATLLTAILFGLAPALRGSRMEVAEAIRDGGAATAGASRLRLGKAVIALQVALSLALLVGAGLFLRTLRNLSHADIGFERQHVLIVDVDPSKLGYHGHRLRTFYDELLEHTRAAAGVRSAALSLMTPMGEFALSKSFSAEGYQPAPGERMGVLANPVSEGYFATLGVPMLLGRDFRPQDEPAVTPKDNTLAAMGRMGGSFNDRDANASRVCIINESLARQLFGGASPLGRHLSFEDRYNAADGMEIVGVVKDVHHNSVERADSRGIIYTPSWSGGAELRFLEVRVAGDPAAVIAGIARQVREMDANVPVLRARRLEEYVNASFQRERLIAYLCAIFGGLALGLAAVGLYGVMACAVTQRTREMGVRIALGAQRGEVAGLVLRESLAPVLSGLVLGTGGALGLARLVEGMLYGVAPRDPLTVALAAAAMLGVSAAAAAIPARRASRVEPMTALRHE